MSLPSCDERLLNPITVLTRYMPRIKARKEKNLLSGGETEEIIEEEEPV